MDDKPRPHVRSQREHAAAHRLAARHRDTADRRAAARDAGYALPVLQAVERIALALQDPRPDPHGPAVAPGDVDDALTLLGHAQAMLESYELHLLDAGRAAGRDWDAIAALLGGPDGTFGGDQAEARHADLRRAFPDIRRGPANAVVQDDAPLAASGTDSTEAPARALPPPARACGIAWGVCPEHGATLAVSGDLTSCQQGDRSWPGDLLNQRCREPITGEGGAAQFRRPGKADLRPV
ncbi:hypothetical protein ABZ897_42980 [Nonomuraea sp. NPDC046802]|uniref:hypothetical protein n=1 Tax=Nonomuraea sp. NPDC046802 TaxID=3154919 RepID=UPI0033E4F601